MWIATWRRIAGRALVPDRGMLLLGRRRRRLPLSAATEAAGEKTATLALAGLALVLLHLLLELLQPLVGRLQRLILHEHGLGEEVGRVGLIADAVGNHLLGLGVARAGRIVAHPIEQALQKLALFG